MPPLRILLQIIGLIANTVTFVCLVIIVVNLMRAGRKLQETTKKLEEITRPKKPYA